MRSLREFLPATLVQNAALLAALLLPAALVLPGGAVASPIGNPVSDFTARQIFTQVSATSGTRSIHVDYYDADYSFKIARSTLMLGYAANEGSIIGATLGTLRVGTDVGNFPTASGIEYGAFYRQAVQPAGPLKHGFSLAYKYGEVYPDTGTVSIYQLMGAYGLSVPAGEKAAFYAGGLYSSFSATYYRTTKPVNSYDAEGASTIGAFAGIEFKGAPSIVLGAELQVLTESNFAAYAQFRF